MYQTDSRIVLTLDAGGTNFIFSAFQGNRNVVEPIRQDANAHHLETCLTGIKDGFYRVLALLPDGAKPVAISFAFPGPADYPRGIIGDLGNLPAFRGGVALGPMLEAEFGLPVFINNDGDLYAYGEALGGILPEVNEMLHHAGSSKRYRNLIGVTLGTGFGAGIVINNRLLIGDNSMAAEVWLLRAFHHAGMNAEEEVSARAIRRNYAKLAGVSLESIETPYDVYEIALGIKPGNSDAAIKAFFKMGEALGNALAQLVTLIDGVVVIGGGLSGAKELIMPGVMSQLKGTYLDYQGVEFPRLVQNVYDLDKPSDFALFLQGAQKEIAVPFSTRKVQYDPQSRVIVAFSRMGASEAIALGAYAYALSQIDEQ
jgi:glucokinase